MHRICIKHEKDLDVVPTAMQDPLTVDGGLSSQLQKATKSGVLTRRTVRLVAEVGGVEVAGDGVEAPGETGKITKRGCLERVTALEARLVEAEGSSLHLSQLYCVAVFVSLPQYHLCA